MRTPDVGGRPPSRGAGFLLLALLLPACATSPLDPFDRIAFTAPRACPDEGAQVPRDAPRRVLDALALRVPLDSRFPVVRSEHRVSPGTLVAHARIRLFEDPAPDRSGAARVDCLLTDAEGRPVLGSRLFALAPPADGPGGKAALDASLGREFGRLLARMGGRLPAAGPVEEEPAGESAPIAAPPPRSPWPPVSAPGRTFAAARLSVLSPGTAPAGRGEGRPRYEDLWSPGLEGSLEIGRAVCPGLKVAVMAAWREFPGRTVARSGLELAFEPLAMKVFGATLRASIPLDRAPDSRWASAWDPFEDTRGLLGELHVAAGGGFTGDVDARVIRDDSGETPAFHPGDRVPYYRRGAVLLGEFLAGLTARLGDGKTVAFSGTLLAGFHASSAPPPRGAGSDSRTMTGLAVAMEIALGF